MTKGIKTCPSNLCPISVFVPKIGSSHSENIEQKRTINSACTGILASFRKIWPAPPPHPRPSPNQHPDSAQQCTIPAALSRIWLRSAKSAQLPCPTPAIAQPAAPDSAQQCTIPTALSRVWLRFAKSGQLPHPLPRPSPNRQSRISAQRCTTRPTPDSVRFGKPAPIHVRSRPVPLRFAPVA
jgi:hypothetical protein